MLIIDYCLDMFRASVKVAAATFTVFTPYNVAPQNRNQPHPTLPAINPICSNTWSFSPDDGHKDARNMSRQ